ncbi:hypothetical protein [Prolixibacter denitrificans]|uniref:Uncharacterized protein n=1 Tax=Prolixibacter denitrificans TaxID=1541063 RepID=A0ABQ0ZLC4_9BACT|nr:hypothetical protein [Prolixibacter denitrificans]GET22114.1 hypothetical protein JCM18694_23600 [Prolixibacter denitrificans]
MDLSLTGFGLDWRKGNEWNEKIVYGRVIRKAELSASDIGCLPDEFSILDAPFG